ncbi:uncharacterized protein LOC131949738 [Physella acuta]|uniref:uncharacterized protein LOC131949738 n=1 Tax=Physella acuta TaxID=109671 RepID=UPI0027DE033D|nr:uncharacterized protein LOC131949738 [Physella acuta]
MEDENQPRRNSDDKHHPEVEVTSHGDDETNSEDEDDDDSLNEKPIDKSNKSDDAGDPEAVQFSLTDPDVLSKQLQETHLNEDETDTLLKEAKKLNAKLKRMLKQQQTSTGAENNSKAHQPKSKSQQLGARQGEGKQRKDTKLPPISTNNSGHTGSKPASGKSRASTTVNPGSRGSPPLRGETGSRGKSARAGRRPEWNDRFSYD